MALAWLAAPALAAATAATPAGSPPAALLDIVPQSAAGYVVAVDDQLVWARDPDTPRLPASLTKLLAALVLIDGQWDPQAPVTISTAAARIEGTRVGLRPGERVRAGDLLTAMLVHSANDACYALAEQHSGNARDFVIRMNERARQLGMAASAFVNPCGLDEPGQRSTPRDLLALARVAAQEPEIRRRAGALRARIQTLGGRKIAFATSNRLLGVDASIVGLKTGFTHGAGECLIALGERNGHRVLVVLMRAADRWQGAARLVSLGFARIAQAELAAHGTAAP